MVVLIYFIFQQAEQLFRRAEQAEAWVRSSIGMPSDKNVFLTFLSFGNFVLSDKHSSSRGHSLCLVCSCCLSTVLADGVVPSGIQYPSLHLVS